MPDTYSVTVDENWNFELKPGDLSGLDLIRTKADNFHLLQGHQSIAVGVRKADFFSKSYEISVNGRVYSVHISDALDQLINSMGFQRGGSKDISEIRAPMPGLILDIPAAEGTTVQEGDPLLILEAMKMENVIASPRAGVVKKICVTKGAAVEKKELLLEFE